MSKSVLFAVVIAISATSLSSACDQCNGGAPLQWVTGCCEHEPSPADHLWDDYCAEKNAPKSHCRRGCKASCNTGCNTGCMPGCSRWRPRPTGNFFGFGGMGAMGGSHGWGESYEAPLALYLEEEVEGDHEHAHEEALEDAEEEAVDEAGEADEADEEAPAETSADVHAKDCQCPKCLAVSADAHGPGCQCPKCIAAADPAKHGAGCTCSACKAAAAEVETSVEEAPAANDVLGEGVEETPGELTFELSADEEASAENNAETLENAINESEENAFDDPFGEMKKEDLEENGFDSSGFDAPEVNQEILNENAEEPESGANFFGLGIELPSFGGSTESDEMQD